MLTFPNIQWNNLSATVQTDGNKKNVTVTVPMQGNVVEAVVRAVLSELGLKNDAQISGFSARMGQQDYLAYAIAHLRSNQSFVNQLETAKRQKRPTLTIAIEVPAMIANAIQQYLTDPMGKPVSSMTATEKIGEAIKRSLPMLPADVAEEVKALLSPETLAIVAAVVIVWAGSHFFGIGEIVDVILLVVGGITLGMVAWKAGEELISFATKAVNATTEGDLDQAAKYFSNAVALIGVQVVTALFLKGRPKVLREPRALMKNPITKPFSLKTMGPLPKTPGKIFYKPQTKGVKLGQPGEGLTTHYGDSFYSTLGTADIVKGARIHERVHQILVPKLQFFREVRVVLNRNSYLQSYIMRYLEEALAETISQISVYGWRNILNGIKFPVKNGYVTIAKMRTEAIGILLGPINSGGMIWNVYFAYTAPPQDGWQETKTTP